MERLVVLLLRGRLVHERDLDFEVVERFLDVRGRLDDVEVVVRLRGGIFTNISSYLMANFILSLLAMLQTLVVQQL